MSNVPCGHRAGSSGALLLFFPSPPPSLLSSFPPSPPSSLPRAHCHQRPRLLAARVGAQAGLPCAVGRLGACRRCGASQQQEQREGQHEAQQAALRCGRPRGAGRAWRCWWGPRRRRRKEGHGSGCGSCSSLVVSCGLLGRAATGGRTSQAGGEARPGGRRHEARLRPAQLGPNSSWSSGSATAGAADELGSERRLPASTTPEQACTPPIGGGKIWYRRYRRGQAADDRKQPGLAHQAPPLGALGGRGSVTAWRACRPARQPWHLAQFQG